MLFTFFVRRVNLKFNYTYRQAKCEFRVVNSNKYEHMLNKEASRHVYKSHELPVIHGIVATYQVFIVPIICRGHLHRNRVLLFCITVATSPCHQVIVQTTFCQNKFCLIYFQICLVLSQIRKIFYMF
jgi:hypothetical protein